MTITFEKIRLCNFLSFGDSEILLDVPGYTLVSGVNNSADDFASSNGSGKSSIWEAISWVLTGETIRGCKNVTNINGNDGALVELTFEVDGDEYIVTRTKDHSKLKSSLTIIINGVDKSGKGIRDGEKLLAEYLPEITSSLLGSVIILGQGLPQKFTANTPSGRKEVLEKLSKSDFMIEDIKSRLNTRISKFTDYKKRTEFESVKCITQREMLLSNREQIEFKLDDLQDVQKLLEDLKFENDYIEYLTEKKNEVEREVSENKKNKDLENTEILSLMQEQTVQIRLIDAQYNDIISELVNKNNEQQLKVDLLKAEIKRKESIVDVCPTCGQKLQGVEKPDTTEDKTKLAFEEGLLDAIVYDYSNKIKERDTKKEECFNEIGDKISNKKAKISEYEATLSALIKSQTELNKEFDEHTARRFALDSQVKSYDEQMNNIKAELEDIDKQVGVLDEKILYIHNEMDTISEHLDVLNKMNTFIKRDFRGYLLHNVIDYLDSKVKMYCNDIYGHENLNFALDGNNISISINGKEYEQLSGGEKQKVDLIVQLAIRDMLCKYTNFSSNIFVLDEIFDNLDAVGSEQVLNMLSKRLEDVSSTYIVTHHSSIEIPVDRQLLVVKDATGISRVEEE